MNASEPGGAGLLAFSLAFLLPLLVCLLLARRGHARTAWWLPGGILVMTLFFMGVGVWLSGEMQTAFGAARSLGLLSAPAILGGVAGILLGRRGT
jgi:integral membrane sensor domain MASE1